MSNDTLHLDNIYKSAALIADEAQERGLSPKRIMELRDVRFLGCVTGGKGIDFVFKSCDETAHAMGYFDGRGLNIDAKTYSEAIEAVRDEIFNYKRSNN
jgi:hypothetical protein